MIGSRLRVSLAVTNLSVGEWLKQFEERGFRAFTIAMGAVLVLVVVAIIIAATA